MGYALDNCPTLHLCCMSVPLRVGVVLIAALGLVWAGAYVFAFSSTGKELLQQVGVAREVGDVMRYVHGVFGVLLCAAHLLLLMAALFESDSLCEVYVWFMVLFWLMLVVSAAVLAVSAVVGDTILLACALLFLTFLTILVSFYFTIVVANYRMTLP